MKDTTKPGIPRIQKLLHLFLISKNINVMIQILHIVISVCTSMFISQYFLLLIISALSLAAKSTNKQLQKYTSNSHSSYWSGCHKKELMVIHHINILYFLKMVKTKKWLFIENKQYLTSKLVWLLILWWIK